MIDTKINEIPVSPPQQNEDEDEGLTFCCGPNAMFSRRNCRRYYGIVADIAHVDKESKRLLQLCWPLTLSSGLGAFFEVLSVSIIANYLGTNTLTAYVVTDLLIGLTDTFLTGPADALNTLCSHAIGAENYNLAGQYVQIAAILYLIVGVPALGFWYVWIGDIVSLMGLDNVADIVSHYTTIVVWHYLISGLFRGYYVLLDISGYVRIGAIFDIVYMFTNVSMLWALCAYWDGINLFWIGVIELINAITFFTIFTILVACKGWIAPFTKGIFGGIALRVS